MTKHAQIGLVSDSPVSSVQMTSPQVTLENSSEFGPQPAPQNKPLGKNPFKGARHKKRFSRNYKSPAPGCRFAFFFPLTHVAFYLAVLYQQGIWWKVASAQPFLLFTFLSFAFHFIIYRCSIAGLESSISAILAAYWNQRSHMIDLTTFGLILEQANLISFLRYFDYATPSTNQYISYIFSLVAVMLMIMILLLPLPRHEVYYKLMEGVDEAATVTFRNFTSVLTFVRKWVSCFVRQRASESSVLESLLSANSDPAANTAHDIESGIIHTPPASVPAATATWRSYFWTVLAMVMSLEPDEDNVMKNLHYSVLILIIVSFATAFAWNAHAYSFVPWAVFCMSMACFAAFFWLKKRANALKKEKEEEQKGKIPSVLLDNAVRVRNMLSLNLEVSAFTYMMLCIILINSA